MGSLNWASDLIPLGSFTSESTAMTLSFFRSDKPVYTTASVRPISPCQPTPAQQDPSFLTSEIPIRPFQADIMIFTDAFTQWGISRYSPYSPQAKYKLFGTKVLILALHHWISVHHGHQVMISTDNTTVVSYNKKQGGTHSHSLLCLVVDLFMWLQAQDIVLRAKHIPRCLNVIADPLSRPNQPITTVWSLHPEIVARIFDIWGAPTVDMFATVHNTLLPQFISLILELQALAIDALSQDWQGRSMYMFPPFPLLNKVIQKLHATQEGEDYAGPTTMGPRHCVRGFE